MEGILGVLIAAITLVVRTETGLEGKEGGRGEGGLKTWGVWCERAGNRWRTQGEVTPDARDGGTLGVL